jgi:hypothetical protein
MSFPHSPKGTHHEQPFRGTATFGNGHSTAVGQRVHSPATHQDSGGQSPSVWHTQLPQSSDMESTPSAQTADQLQHGRGPEEQLKLPTQGSPFAPRARTS